MSTRTASRPSENMVHRLIEAHCDAGRGDVAAVIDDEGAWTYADLSTHTARAAGALLARGVRRGERVAVALPDSRAWLAAYFGAARLGAVPFALDPAQDGERRLRLLADAEPAALVAGPGLEAPGCAVIGPDEIAAGEPAPVAAVHPEDLGYILYTSGSTGIPKGAMHAHRDMAVGIDGYAKGILGLGPDDRCHTVARCFTAFGFGDGLWCPLGGGATVILSARRPNPRTVLALVRRHRVTTLAAVPTFWAQLAAFLDRHPGDAALESLRLAISAGENLPASVGQRVRQALGVDVIEGLGCSECSSMILCTRPGEPRWGTLGQPSPGVELRLADDEGRPVPPGEPGRVWVRCEGNTSGYWRNAAETRELVFGPWLRMRDVVRQDGDDFRYVGRVDELFKVGGRWVSPAEVEGALHEHPAVEEAAVIGRPDERGLMRPVAFVVLAGRRPARDGLAEELRRHVAHRLEPYKAPAGVTVVRTLPRLASGKVDRLRLRSPAAPADGGDAPPTPPAAPPTGR